MRGLLHIPFSDALVGFLVMREISVREKMRWTVVKYWHVKIE